MAIIVTMVEMAPVMARLPEEKIAPIRGVIKVVPQVGQPAPRAISPVMMLAFSMLAEFEVVFAETVLDLAEDFTGVVPDFDAESDCRFLCQSKTIRPINMLCNNVMAKMYSQSRNGTLMPKIPKKDLPIICKLAGKPMSFIISKFDKPPDKRLSKVPKNIKDGIKPAQKRFSLVASKMPFPAKTKPSNHFLQFIYKNYNTNN